MIISETIYAKIMTDMLQHNTELEDGLRLARRTAAAAVLIDAEFRILSAEVQNRDSEASAKELLLKIARGLA